MIYKGTIDNQWTGEVLLLFKILSPLKTYDQETLAREVLSDIHLLEFNEYPRDHDARNDIQATTGIIEIVRRCNPLV